MMDPFVLRSITVESGITVLSFQDYISAVQFSQDGFYLAIGLSSNAIQLWDVETKRLLRTLNGI